MWELDLFSALAALQPERLSATVRRMIRRSPAKMSSRARVLPGTCWVSSLVIAVSLAACQGADGADDAASEAETAGTEADADDGSGGAPTGTVGDTGVEPDSGTGAPACDTPEACADAAEAATADAMSALRDSPEDLQLFLAQMPLGGDLHHHLSGGVYAETFLSWADQDGGYCITESGLALSTSCGDGNDVPVPTANDSLYLDIVRAWSMFEFEPSGGESGADHFFATFSKFGAISGREHGRMLADIRRRASNENVLYIEPMLTSNSTARSLGEDEWDTLGGGDLTEGDYAGLHAALLASSGFAAARARLTDDAENSENIADGELGCASESPGQGCEVVTRYQAYISRSGSDPGIFGQMVAAYEAAMVEPRIVGLNLVGPEDGNAAMANYDRLMAMLGYLNDYYAGMSPLRLSLHAGEITQNSVPAGYQLDETQHIRKAVEIAGARRIGHGVDVMSENDPEQLLEALRDSGVLVEICFASNEIILQVGGSGHAVHDYIEAGVPVALATDDQGVARSSLAAEYYRGVVDQQLGYLDIKAMARASLEYSFLEGESFWAEPGVVVSVCAPAEGDTPVTQEPVGECAAYLADNLRAGLQRELEVRFEEFEAKY